MTQLTPLGRMVVGTSTTTDMFAAVAHEPIDADILHQSYEPADMAMTQFDVDPDQNLLIRRVVLRGSRTGAPLAAADSVLVAKRLPAAMSCRYARRCFATRFGP